MRRFPRNSLVVCAAMVVAVAMTARAEVDPDESFGAVPADPYDSWSYRIGARWGPGLGMSFSYQPRDCNKAGPAQPVLFPPRSFMEGMKSYFGGSGASWRGGRLSIYDKGQIGLSEFFPGEASGNYSELRNYGSDQGPTIGSTADFDQRVPWSSSAGDIEGFEMPSGMREVGAGLWRRDYDFDDLPPQVFQPGNMGAYNSLNVETPIGGFPDDLSPFLNQQYDLGGTTWSSLLFPEEYTGDVVISLQSAGFDYFFNPCWKVQVPSDPNFLRTGRHGGNSWGAKLDDQWAIKRVGLTGDEDSAWNIVPDNAEPVVVAVIDTGLDWHHLDIDPASIWRNEREVPGNGVDDDQNGYVDDIIGWDFLGKHNRPWDFDGHGTLVAGIIAAAHNDVGIAGINPGARIMVLKGVNNFGTTRPSFIAEAIVYAVDNGARVINISVGGPHSSRMVQAAVDYARQQGVLVVAAAGNEGIELGDYGPAGGENVLTVGATHDDDRGTGFANYGDKVDIAAPGVEVLSLRARLTDASYRPGETGANEYQPGDYFVGDDKRYARANGTSFSAPIVSGVASLLISKNPELTADQVERILLQTAKDVERPGRDPHTGYGMVDARAALSVESDFSVTAEITALELFPADGPQYVSVRGTIDASDFKRAWMQIGPGENPGGWRFVGQKRKFPIVNGEIGTIPLRSFSSSGLWQVVVNVEHKNGVVKRAAFPLEVK